MAEQNNAEKKLQINSLEKLCAEHNEEINELRRIIQEKLRNEQEEYEMAE